MGVLLQEGSMSSFLLFLYIDISYHTYLKLISMTPEQCVQYNIPMSSVADLNPGSGASLTPGFEMNNPDHISESLETIFLSENTKIL